MDRPEWDLVIIGGGPAGTSAAAAALTADPGLRVLIVDRQDFPRDKVCGDGIAAEALDGLAALGFDLDAVLDGCPPLGRLRLTAPGGTVVDRRMARTVRVIPRELLDARLMADVRARGVAFERRTVRDVVAAADHVVVDGTLRASVVIGADGAESTVRRAASAQRGRRPADVPRRVALAMRGYAAELPGQADTQLITMSARHWPAYAWSFPLGDGRANVGYGELLTGRTLSRADLVAGMRRLLPGLDPEPTSLRAHRLPLSPGRPRIGDGRVLLAGDALSLVNPLSGEGIFYAVTSGALAGRAAAAAVTGGGDPGAAYRTTMTATLGRHLRTTDGLDRLLRRPLLLDAGVRAAAARQGAFDDLVRLSLADGTFTARLAAGVVGQLLPAPVRPRVR
ncbi:NAD(P)/FAD-dependent oxidoreductase [Nakamurella deserti]|uniref:NAD(P)/FAD-dependent oxidoreductase n=1 Tax=Nakamurella deserti TaxID=2164074 RepID=UPI000DBE9EB3|nr:NAD(P)/FAD-dependent oxidoreductase [Nakamurella deserti]